MSSYPLPFSFYKVAAFFSNPPFRAGDLKLMREIQELTGALPKGKREKEYLPKRTFLLYRWLLSSRILLFARGT